MAVHAPDRAFAPGVQTALMRLGYNLISARTANRQRSEGLLQPQARIVDERQLNELSARDDDLPQILLIGASSSRKTSPDKSTLGPVRRRARLNELYGLLQNALEPIPRSVPRVVDALPARATRGLESWTGAIRSISEKGCLLQTTTPLDEHSHVEICFPLAKQGLVQLPAVPSYHDGEHTGLVFGPLLADSELGVDLMMIGGFVTMTFAWFGLARVLKTHVARLKALERYGHWLTPIVLILVGLYILNNTSTDVLPGD